MKRAGLLAVFLAGCAFAPEGTNLDRIYRSLYHQDHPEYGRPITLAVRHADFTGTHLGISPSGQAAWERESQACVDAGPSGGYEAVRTHLWACLWARGWRWDTDAAPTP